MLYARIEADHKEARTAKLKAANEADKLAFGVKASLLGTLLGDINTAKTRKPANEVTDKLVEDLTMDTIRSFLKKTNQTIADCEQNGRDASQSVAEKAILESYLPQQMTAAEIAAAVEGIITDLGLERTKAAKGRIMGELKARHEGQYNGADAAKAVDTVLNG
jgi:uncharacterized protein YqeY